MEELKEGWGAPNAFGKWHYFRGKESLCRKWFLYMGRLEQGSDNSPDNCKACMRRLLAEKPSKEG